ncbi:EamA family transporter [Coraliomargarita parva]|uniref:EamA family transporter n=1 Tax=Coraliomargarita parva TaxID=3014050 RepID=UPI0022B3AD95|nr:DMT family transporter [Coraliomargarita parva]
MDTRDRWKGIALVLNTGCCWGFHGVLIKFAYSLGASFLQVFLVEALFASLYYGCFARGFLKTVRPRGWSQWLQLSGIGLASVGVGNLLFLAFSLGPVAIAATLMFMYLPVVYAVSLISGNQSFSAPKLCSILLVLIGATLTTQIFSSLGEPGAVAAVFSALAASFCYALVFILTPGVASFTTVEFRSFSISAFGLVGCLIVWCFVPSLWYPLDGQLGSFLIMAIVLGVVGQTLPVLTLMKGLPITGSSLGGVLASVELPIAVFSSAILLGESLSPSKIVGVVLVLSGIVLYNYSDRVRVPQMATT